jgi:type 1 glutamine amidotransferase
VGKHILMVLGGTWHDFEGFAAAMTPVIENAGHRVTATYEPEAIAQLGESGYDLVLLNTCIGERREDDGPTALGFTDAQAESLARWVRGGGGLLSMHAATVASQSSPALRALQGGIFVSHPPQFSFTVYPLYEEHPITAGIEAFAVYDEFYVQDYDPSVEIHMIALDQGVAHPMVWSKREGKGRVAYIAMGHDLGVWSLEPYQRLTLQAIDWLTA